MNTEYFIFFLSCFLLYRFFRRWYKPVINAWPREANRAAKTVLSMLPLVFLVLVFLILKFLASFDVVDSFIYIVFYIVLGFAWMYTGILLMTLCFGLREDDSVYLNNKAALAAVIGEFFSIAFIYLGANVGDGPGWWCVLFAGFLGLATWVLLGFFINICTGIFERITVERDLGCAVRFCIYLFISGAILGYACSGDWTSFKMTIVEFGIGWPVLPLTALFIIIELLVNFFQKIKNGALS